MKSRFLWAPRSVAFVFLCASFSLLPPNAAAQDIFLTPIPNVPFTAVIEAERSFVRPDGSVTLVKTERQIARDGRGRVYSAGGAMVPDSGNQQPEVRRIHLYDPQTRLSTVLDPTQRTFWTITVNHPPATAPPRLLEATPAGNTLQQSEFTKKEDLGIQEIGGIPAHGVREMQTIPADASGTGKEVVVTDEYWYSDDLRINVLIKHNDPRRATATLTVTKVQRFEPDSALFEIPAGYKHAGTQ